VTAAGFESLPSTTVRSADGTAIEVRSIGRGEPLLVVGGALRSGIDYLPLAEALAARFLVHIVERRGRGGSGPMGDDYGMAREREDLLAVQAATGAERVFGHSYGGLVVLETAARAAVFRSIALYEPGVSVGDSVPVHWIPRYRRLLENGKPRAAFACFVQGSGQAPGPVARLPLWYLSLVLRMAIEKEQWRRFEPLLAANLLEHLEVAAHDDAYEGYAAIGADVLLLGGSRSAGFTSAELLPLLQRTIPRAEAAILDGLDHNAPDEKAPAQVAERVLAFLSRA
jgi:pimeloyl-ACP methyl ester carboxylesterase